MASLRTAKRFVFPLLGLWVLLYASFSMVKPPLLDGADALSAEIGREMLTAGHWITPWANGFRYAHHSPLLYWTIAWSFGLFGVSDWAARLPVALATLGLFTATFSLGRRIFHAPAAAFYATLALMTSYGVFLFGHLLLPDVFLCLWTTLAINCFWRSLEQKAASPEHCHWLWRLLRARRSHPGRCRSRLSSGGRVPVSALHAPVGPSSALASGSDHSRLPGDRSAVAYCRPHRFRPSSAWAPLCPPCREAAFRCSSSGPSFCSGSFPGASSRFALSASAPRLSPIVVSRRGSSASSGSSPSWSSSASRRARNST